MCSMSLHLQYAHGDTAALIHNAMSIMNYLAENYHSNLTQGGVNICWNALSFANHYNTNDNGAG